MADILTRVGDVVDAVLEISKALATELAQEDPEQRIDVHDGPALAVLYERALIVGMTDGPDNPGYRSVIDRAQGMGRRKTETVTVHCLVTLSTGDDDAIARLRSEASAVMRDLDEQLRSDDVVERPWQRIAVLGDADWVPLVHDEGSTVNVLFDIEAVCLL